MDRMRWLVLLCATAVAGPAFSQAVDVAEIPATDARKLTPAEQLIAAEEQILAPLTERQREIVVATVDNGGRPPVINPLEKEQLTKGAWGTLDSGNRVIDTVTTYHGDTPVPTPVYSHPDTTFEITQVLDKQSLLMLEEGLWLEVGDTSALVDGQTLDMRGHVFEVIGTKQYDTAIRGTNTVHHLREVDAGPIFAAATKLTELRQFRIWRDASGKFEVAAVYRGYKAGVVTLSALDGRDVKVPLKRLSKEDRGRVQAIVRNQR